MLSNYSVDVILKGLHVLEAAQQSMARHSICPYAHLPILCLFLSQENNG